MEATKTSDVRVPPLDYPFIRIRGAMKQADIVRHGYVPAEAKLLQPQIWTDTSDVGYSEAARGE